MTEQKPNAAGQLNVASEEKILADLLGNLPSEEEITVDVPSKGRFYNLLDPTKPITIRPLTFADEKKLMTNRAGGTEALNKLIEKCVQNVNISELPVNYLPDDFSNPIEIELPVLKKKIKVRLPRVEDEAYMRNPEIALANLWRFVEEIEGHTQKTIISKVIQKLPLKDAHALMNAMGSSGYGMDTRIRFACSYCSLIETMELPIGADFFTNN